MSDSARSKTPVLSKSRFMAGLQCHKRLYYECYRRELADPVDASQQAIFDTGNKVGTLARRMYPGGVLISEDYLHHGGAMATTEKAMANPSIQAIYEVAFLYDDIRVRTDILERENSGTFNLIEVKSATSVKEEHIPDIAVQLYVLEGSNTKVGRTYLAHLNKGYVYQGGDYNLNQLFRLEDVTKEARHTRLNIESDLQAMRLPLRGPQPPDIKTGKQCAKPYVCPFYGHCHSDEPDHHIGQLPRASEKLLLSLEEAGIDNIRDIPLDFPGLSANQQRVRDCVINDYFYMDPELPRLLQKLEYPIHFLDFETFNPALPMYIGTRPYQVIPFQWSDHILEEDGTLLHKEFLHDGLDDPRKPFAETLLRTLGSGGSIVVYSGYEVARIRELATFFPDLTSALLDLLDGRVVDLLQLIRQFCYHPGFHGSFSIKSVLPALVHDLDYNDLEISDGSMASVVYSEIMRPGTSPERRGFLRTSLLSYCRRDTEAEVRIYEALRGARPPQTPPLLQ